MTFFQHSCLCPYGVDWKKWILDFGRTDDVITYNKIVHLIHDKSHLPKLTKDVWNVIMYHIYYKPTCVDPDLWEDDIFSWLEYWISHPNEHKSNPIHFFESNEEVVSSALASMINMKLTHAVYSRTNSSTIYKTSLNEIIITLPRISDVVLGICVDNISNIKLCNLEIGGQMLRSPFIFTSKYAVKLGDKIYYHHPHLNIIPILGLAYQEVNLRIVLKNEKETCPKICILEMYIDSQFRSKLALTPHCFGEGKNRSKTEMGCWRYIEN